MTLDRDQIKRDAEQVLSRYERHMRTVAHEPIFEQLDKLARHCLALLTELEQAEEHVDGLSADLYDAQTLRSEAEYRLAKTPALVEALTQARLDVIAVTKDGWDSTRGRRGVQAITRIDDALAAWEAE